MWVKEKNTFLIFDGSDAAKFFIASVIVLLNWHGREVRRTILPVPAYIGRICLKCDGTRAETRFRLSA